MISRILHYISYLATPLALLGIYYMFVSRGIEVAELKADYKGLAYMYLGFSLGVLSLKSKQRMSELNKKWSQNIKLIKMMVWGLLALSFMMPATSIMLMIKHDAVFNPQAMGFLSLSIGYWALLKEYAEKLDELNSDAGCGNLDTNSSSN